MSRRKKKNCTVKRKNAVVVQITLQKSIIILYLFTPLENSLPHPIQSINTI